MEHLEYRRRDYPSVYYLTVKNKKAQHSLNDSRRPIVVPKRDSIDLILIWKSTKKRAGTKKARKAASQIGMMFFLNYTISLGLYSIDQHIA